jgi:hypothetical protein
MTDNLNPWVKGRVYKSFKLINVQLSMNRNFELFATRIHTSSDSY